jgi:hypothetical protein
LSGFGRLRLRAMLCTCWKVRGAELQQPCRSTSPGTPAGIGASPCPACPLHSRRLNGILILYPSSPGKLRLTSSLRSFLQKWIHNCDIRYRTRHAPHAGSSCFRSFPPSLDPMFSSRVCLSHPWQTVSTPMAGPRTQLHRGHAFFLKMSCQNSLNSCSDEPMLNNLLLGSGWGRLVHRIDCRPK